MSEERAAPPGPRPPGTRRAPRAAATPAPAAPLPPPSQRAGGTAPAPPIDEGSSADPAVTEPGRRRSARQALRSRREVRRAIVLRELLGPPVALRRGRSEVPGLGA